MAFIALKHTLQSFDLFLHHRVASKPVTSRKHQFIDLFIKAYDSFIEKIVINILVQKMRIINSTYLPIFTFMCALHFT